MIEISQIIILIGLLVTAALGTKGWFNRIGIPAMVGFLILGWLLRLGHDATGLVGEKSQGALEVMGDIGIVCLLFRVGLEADLRELLQQLRSASFIWICNVLVSGWLGYFAATHWLGLELLPSLFLAVALTASSIAIPVQIWQSQGALKTRNGQRFLEVAELDDISAVVLMALLFWVAEDLQGGAGGTAIAAKVGRGLLEFGLKFLGFVVSCYLFARFLEKPITSRLSRLKPAPDPMLSIGGIAFVIAGVAGMLGFSLAVGAFFAGLAFSRDPLAVRMEASFETLFELFTPFFFIHVGFLMAPGALEGSLVAGGVLLVVAIAGKVVGTVFPARLGSTWGEARILAVSMVPRSEICLLILQTALASTAVALPDSIFAGMVLVCAITSVGAPLLLQGMLRRQQPDSGRGSA